MSTAQFNVASGTENPDGGFAQVTAKITEKATPEQHVRAQAEILGIMELCADILIRLCKHPWLAKEFGPQVRNALTPIAERLRNQTDSPFEPN